MTSRERKAALAVLGLVLIAVGLSLAVIWHHRHDLSKDRAVTHTRSYIYGEKSFDRVLNRKGLPVSDPAYCRAAFRLHPARFAGYSEAIALKGCLAEFSD